MKKIFFAILVLLIGCTSKTALNEEQIKKAVWETVKAHNIAWSQLEDLTELEKYVDENIISISPPFKEPIYGKKAYLDGYQSWFDHAQVDYFRETNPQIQLHLNGTMAMVTFEIAMSFDYDDQKTPDWKGRDVMTLKFEKDKWLIISDLFVKYE